ncbi:MAG: flagellar assembly protein FliH [Treponema sp. GWB1_62_6]|nr:MAG: flagellar assembly protein FliH [Treponema sp. GWA1_62_8]OHE63916.1 MAG: flagellar assembly protein FliH [Treponema sp. GWC1_61_84]OHE67125.1 MAG: flagellar assembly protein FliH [Treponema sp. GWB1_62_6]OHE76460.1 MAG: flagellar assembly protein FliH [Treponema sp. RIFOXYC1_FULL_61_9]HCM25237.1 flagellar assembly protein FliH [Treponema sp.]
MAKAVFRHGEIRMSDKKVMLEAPTGLAGTQAVVRSLELDELDEVEEYSGPTADDLRREAEAFKAQWDKERELLINSARAEAETIVKEAEAAAFQEVKRKSDHAQKIRREAEDEAERLVSAAKAESAAIEGRAATSVDAVRKDAELRGFEAGREAGFAEGRAESDRLVERLHTILERAQDKRAEILAETEQQIVDLVLLIARKVIKVISENQRNVVVSNVVQALRKVKGRGDVTIRVNVDDIKLTTEHTKDFIRIIEGVKNISVVEDSSVDRGGCLIDTEFGEVDARISSQLAELEQKILEISPIKARARTIPLDER